MREIAPAGENVISGNVVVYKKGHENPTFTGDIILDKRSLKRPFISLFHIGHCMCLSTGASNAPLFRT